MIVWPRLHGAPILRLAACEGEQLPRKRSSPQPHDHKQIVEVVGDTAGQLAERFHLLRLRKLLLCEFECFLGIAAFGNVAGDFGEANEFSGDIMDRAQ